jgi:hypothetical protein
MYAQSPAKSRAWHSPCFDTAAGHRGRFRRLHEFFAPRSRSSGRSSATTATAPEDVRRCSGHLMAEPSDSHRQHGEHPPGRWHGKLWGAVDLRRGASALFARGGGLQRRRPRGPRRGKLRLLDQHGRYGERLARLRRHVGGRREASRGFVGRSDQMIPGRPAPSSTQETEQPLYEPWRFFEKTAFRPLRLARYRRSSASDRSSTCGSPDCSSSQSEATPTLTLTWTC